MAAPGYGHPGISIRSVFPAGLWGPRDRLKFRVRSPGGTVTRGQVGGVRFSFCTKLWGPRDRLKFRVRSPGGTVTRGAGILIKYGSNTVTESAQQVSQLSTHCKVLARGLDRAMPNIRLSPRQVPSLVHASAAGPLPF